MLFLTKNNLTPSSELRTDVNVRSFSREEAGLLMQHMRDFERLPRIEAYLTRQGIEIVRCVEHTNTHKEMAYYLRRRFGLAGSSAEVIKR